VVEAAHSILLSIKLLAETINTAVYILHQTEPISVKENSLTELWNKKEAVNINHLHVFGTDCFIDRNRTRKVLKVVLSVTAE